MINVMLLIGYAAAVLTAIAPVPQLIKAVKTRSTKDVSLSAFLFLFLLCILWTIYGFYIKDTPLIIGDFIGAVVCIAIVVLKLKFG